MPEEPEASPDGVPVVPDAEPAEPEPTVLEPAEPEPADEPEIPGAGVNDGPVWVSAGAADPENADEGLADCDEA